jgi:hypothetical protein
VSAFIEGFACIVVAGQGEEGGVYIFRAMTFEPVKSIRYPRVLCVGISDDATKVYFGTASGTKVRIRGPVCRNSCRKIMATQRVGATEILSLVFILFLKLFVRHPSDVLVVLFFLLFLLLLLVLLLSLLLILLFRVLFGKCISVNFHWRHKITRPRC